MADFGLQYYFHRTLTTHITEVSALKGTIFDTDTPNYIETLSGENYEE